MKIKLHEIFFFTSLLLKKLRYEFRGRNGL